MDHEIPSIDVFILSLMITFSITFLNCVCFVISRFEFPVYLKNIKEDYVCFQNMVKKIHIGRNIYKPYFQHQKLNEH